MPQVPIPPPRVPPLPIAQLVHSIPADPPVEQNAYDKVSKAGSKGGLPMEIVAAAQLIYQHPQVPPQPGGASQQGLKPGWGGQGTI